MKRIVAPGVGRGLPSIHGSSAAPAAEEVPEPHHGEGVQAAVGVQLPADLFLPVGWGVREDARGGVTELSIAQLLRPGCNRRKGAW